MSIIRNMKCRSHEDEWMYENAFPLGLLEGSKVDQRSSQIQSLSQRIGGELFYIEPETVGQGLNHSLGVGFGIPARDYSIVCHVESVKEIDDGWDLIVSSPVDLKIGFVKNTPLRTVRQQLIHVRKNLSEKDPSENYVIFSKSYAQASHEERVIHHLKCLLDTMLSKESDDEFARDYNKLVSLLSFKTMVQKIETILVQCNVNQSQN